MISELPTRWDLTNIFPGLESEEFKQAFADSSTWIDELMECFNTNLAPLPVDEDIQKLNTALGIYVDQLNKTSTNVGKISNYLYSFISTDSYNKLATRLMSEFEQKMVRLDNQDVIFKNWLSKIKHRIDEIIAVGGTVAEHAYALKEIVHFSQFIMSQAEEELASELNLSGASNWEKLQGVITSQLSVEIEIDGEMKKLPGPALISFDQFTIPSIGRSPQTGL